MLGRLVGLVFAAPCAYFFARGQIPSVFRGRMAVLFTMGGTQGLVGWWMVKSGLTEDRRGDKNQIRVSPYRLATHLSMAIGTYSLLLWTAFSIFQYPNEFSHTKPPILQFSQSLSREALRLAKRLRLGAIAFSSIAGITAISGAFVAGNDAGRAYNTFPKMDGHWIPPFQHMFPLQPIWRNLFETTPTVQWNHRVLGITTATSAAALSAIGLFASRGTAVAILTPQTRLGLCFVGAAGLGQASLGIVTLLNYVPISLAAAHQLGSLVVLSSGIYAVHTLRYASPAVLARIATTATSNIASRTVATATTTARVATTSTTPTAAFSTVAKKVP